jgi:hypothetical protein
MPNGKGNWMRSDPRKDTETTTKANQRHGGLLLPVIRLIKYWNKHRLRQGLSSYYVETLCLNVFDNSAPITSTQSGLATFFRQAPAWVRRVCPDPKGYGPPLDSAIARDTKRAVIIAMKEAGRLAQVALRHEHRDETSDALDVWAQVLGKKFLP